MLLIKVVLSKVELHCAFSVVVLNVHVLQQTFAPYDHPEQGNTLPVVLLT